MNKLLKMHLALSFTAWTFLSTPFILFSQTYAVTACTSSEVGRPQGAPIFPAECNATVGPDGITFPPDMVCKPDGYCQLPHPQPQSGSYKAINCAAHSQGSKELVGVLYTVSERWKQKYPNGYMRIADLNAPGHKSHNWGYAVDIDATTDGTDCVADYVAGGLSRNCGGNKYNRDATVELGKMFVDTGAIRQILYMGQDVNAAVMEYANQTGKSPGMQMFPVARHDNHFHVDVRIEKLPFYNPGC